MRNVKWAIEGNKLTIEVDLSKETWESASGKTLMVASSEGNSPLGDDLVLGLNIYKKKRR